ncbi:abortive infection family protein [Clostridium frigidicarnis]|uniref:Abortive infection C-terminus n=1 Tax=Clostridium frigidicarnis TaxID=84698 RepID=A0A1I1B3V6_9CLOT|nr:abortive infection family protein [Clostridium frigidicarnis]SFB43280.1 Abortive infection C-terminus [Clostridium frigidicarnis]
MGKVFRQGIYAEQKIREIVSNGRVVDLINELLAPIKYVDCDKSVEEILKYVNNVLNTEGYNIIPSSIPGKYQLLSTQNNTIVVKKEELKILSSEFLIEQVEKCNKKIAEEDLYGAITNARSMVEEVLLAIEEELCGVRGENTGDMAALYKRVAKLINFDAGKQGLITPLRQILSGLNNIVIGVASLRTKASDSHAPEYKPEKHHAREYA